MPSDLAAIRSVAGAFGSAGVCAIFAIGAAVEEQARLAAGTEPPTWLSTIAAAAPWRPGEPLPLVTTLTPRWGSASVVEDERTGLVVAAEPELATPAVGTDGEATAGSDAGVEPGVGTPAVGDPGGGDPGGGDLAVGTPSAPGLAGAGDPGLPRREPMVPTALVDADHRGMAPFYAALARGDGLARAAWWGDSTIAADGITGTVRTRLQARFGYGGPGWVQAGLDKQWSYRPDLPSSRAGDWSTRSILLGGATGRYGFGGVVSTATDGGYLTVRTPEGADGARRPVHHLELWYQAGVGHGSWWLSADDVGVGAGSAAAEGRQDLRHVVEVPEGFTKLAFGATGGPVPFYGAVLETQGPGVVLDSLGVVGVGSRSFNYQHDGHLSAQVAERRPDLVVLMLGGNELGIPVLQRGDGSAYATTYRGVLRKLRAGAPAAGCLVVTPLDQATRDGGTPHTKPALTRLVAAQGRVAAEEGCAFWNAFAAMGGEGAIVAWTRRKPPLAWTDLLHLSAGGQDLVGQSLSDAVEAGYADWTRTHTP